MHEMPVVSSLNGIGYWTISIYIIINCIKKGLSKKQKGTQTLSSNDLMVKVSALTWRVTSGFSEQT